MNCIPRSFCSLLFLALFFMGSCVEKSAMYDDDGASKELQRVSIRHLKSLYAGYALPIEAPYEIRGWVTANDRYGGYSHTIVLQDETAGIEVKVSGDQLYLHFAEGSEMIVRTQALVLGSYGGVVSLGVPSEDPAYENSFIPASAWSSHLHRTGEFKEIAPLRLTIDELTDQHVGCYVSLQGVQFIDAEVGLVWSDPIESTDRHLVDRLADTLIVRTRSEADYAQELLPFGSGYIEGVLSYFNRSYQLRIVDPSTVGMGQPRFALD